MKIETMGSKFEKKKRKKVFFEPLQLLFLILFLILEA